MGDGDTAWARYRAASRELDDAMKEQDDSPEWHARYADANRRQRDAWTDHARAIAFMDAMTLRTRISRTITIWIVVAMVAIGVEETVRHAVGCADMARATASGR